METAVIIFVLLFLAAIFGVAMTVLEAMAADEDEVD